MNGDDGTAAAVEPKGDETSGVMAVGGADIFISERRNRRVRVPASIRRGRHQTKGPRHALDATNDRAGSSQRMYLVDVDGQTETARIALRRTFEDISAANSSSEAHPSPELRQSVAG
jgi:hypothetical protein